MPIRNLGDMLKACDFQTEERVMMARHTMKRSKEPQELIDLVRGNDENFAKWQAVQSKRNKGGKPSVGSRFIGCGFVMSFCKVDGDRARFAGMFRNISDNPPQTLNEKNIGMLLPEFADIYRAKMRGERREYGSPVARFLFRFRRISAFKKFEGRVVIDLPGVPCWVKPYTAADSRKRVAITPEWFGPFHNRQ